MWVITNNERNYIVYCHVFPTGETLKECKKYFGITGQSYKERWGNNGIGYYGQYVFSAILYYGWSNIKHYIMYKNLTKEEAEQKEIELIARYKTTDPRYGYNVSNGGSSVNNLRINARKVVCINTNEIFDTLTEASDKYNVNRGNISECCFGIRKTAGRLTETNEKLIWQYYDEWLIEPKEYIVDCSKSEGCIKTRRVMCIETNTIYNSIKEAATINCLKADNVSRVCRGITRTAGGLHWKYVD